MLFVMGHPQLHAKCSLYECTRVQRSKIFKQYRNISIHLIFIDFWLISGIPPWWMAVGGLDGSLVSGWVGWVGWWVGSGQITKKILKCWPNQDISILFEDLWFVETLPLMAGYVGDWLGQWVNGWVRSNH